MPEIFNRSLKKFFSDHGGPEHGGPLMWPGVNGFPFRGETAPDLRGKQYEDMPLALDFKSRSFRLWDDREKAAFDAIMDRIVNGWYMQHKRFDNWIEQHQEYVVHLEWVQIYGEEADEKHPGGKNVYVVGSQPGRKNFSSEPPRPRIAGVPDTRIRPGGFGALQDRRGRDLL